MSASASNYTISQALHGLREDQLRRKGLQTGHLRKRGGIYHVDYWKWRTMNDGALKYVKVSESTHKAKYQEARSKANEIVSKANANSHCPQGIATVNQFIDTRYRVDVMATQRTSTRKLKEFLLRKHVLPTLGGIALTDVTPTLVQMLLNGKNRAGLEPQTVTHIRNLISSIFRYARSLQFFQGQLPTEGARLPRIDSPDKRALTRDQLDLFAAQLREPYRTLVLFLASTGLRVGEAIGLRWRRFNLTDQKLIVDGEEMPPWSVAVREAYSHSEYHTLKTKAGRRTIVLDTEASVLMLEHMARYAERPADGPVFFGKGGLPLDYHNAANRVIKPGAKKCGLGWITFHVLRHTAVTWADAKGLSDAEKSKRFGHSPEMSVRYTHPDGEGVREKLERVN